MNSRIGKGNVIRQLKSWREAGSPAYEFALAHSSLVVLDPALVLWMRYSGGERAKFEAKGSWLHKKRKRLTRFILGRPASRTPSLSDSADAFVRHCRYYGQRNTPYSSRNNEWIELVGKDVVRMNDYGKDTPHKQQRWKGQCLWSTSHKTRAHRQAWWRAYRRIRVLLRGSRRRGPEPYAPLVNWAMENKITRPTRSIRKRKHEKPLGELRCGRELSCAEEAGGADEDDGSPQQANASAWPADPLRQLHVDGAETPESQALSAFPTLCPQIHVGKATSQFCFQACCHACFVMLRCNWKSQGLSDRDYLEERRSELKAKAARMQETEGGQPTCNKLVAVITRWGTSSTLKNFAQPSDLLWQVLVEHEDGPRGLGSFRSHLLVTLQQALLQHPDAHSRDLQGLRRNSKVIVLNGAPYEDEGATSYRHMSWVPTMYVAGPTPYAALEVVRLVMEEKARQRLLTQVPSELHVAWQFGKPPVEPLPSPWKAVDGHRPITDQFEVQPPEAPRVRYHLKGYFEQTSTKPLKFRLVLDEGIDAFQKAFNDAGIPLRAPNPRFPYCLARILDNLGVGDGGKHRLSGLLHQVLGGRPVQLCIGAPACSNGFTAWLQEQPGVVLLS